MLLWLGGVLALPLFCAAQNLSRGGRFSSDKLVGCAPLTIHITPLDNFGSNVSRQYIYEENAAVSNDPSHTFANPGIYHVVQVIGLDISPKTDTLTITVHPPEAPEVQVANCRNYAASVRTPAAPYDFYRVYYTATDSVDVAAGSYSAPFDFGGPGSYQVRVKGFYTGGNDACGETTLTVNTLQSLSQPTLNSIETFVDNTLLLSATINPGISYVLQVSEEGDGYSEIPLVFQGSQILADGLDPLHTSYCFRLAAYDPCNDEFYYSNELCQVALSVSYEEFRNHLSWNQPAASANSWQVLRNGTSLLQSANHSIVSYADSSLVCNTEYCYQLRINYPDGYALSQEICGTSFEEQSLLPVASIYSTYEADALLIQWENPQQIASPVYRLLYAGGSEVEGPSFSSEDTAESFGNREFFRQSLRYTIVYSDECGNRSPAALWTTPIFLNLHENAANSYTLTWNQYLPLPDGVRQYFVELWDQEMNLLSTLPAWDPGILDLRLSSELSGVAWATVRAEGLGADAGFTSRSNRQPVEFTPGLYIPTAFTPNGDGLNDLMMVEGVEVSDFQLQIYNRWGELVFATTDQTLGWDGTFKGKPAPQGAYHYFVEGTDERGNKIKKTGNFVLLRN